MENNNNPQNEADKLNAIANIIASSGGVIGSVGGFFGKGPQQTVQPEYTATAKVEDDKKKRNQLLMFGGGALILIIILIMFKNK